jgi:hypothetical protein
LAEGKFHPTISQDQHRNQAKFRNRALNYVLTLSYRKWILMYEQYRLLHTCYSIILLFCWFAIDECFHHWLSYIPKILSYGSWKSYVYTSTARRRHDQFDALISHAFLSLLLRGNDGIFLIHRFSWSFLLELVTTGSLCL